MKSFVFSMILKYFVASRSDLNLHYFYFATLEKSSIVLHNSCQIQIIWDCEWTGRIIRHCGKRSKWFNGYSDLFCFFIWWKTECGIAPSTSEVWVSPPPPPLPLIFFLLSWSISSNAEVIDSCLRWSLCRDFVYRWRISYSQCPFRIQCKQWRKRVEHITLLIAQFVYRRR